MTEPVSEAVELLIARLRELSKQTNSLGGTSIVTPRALFIEAADALTAFAAREDELRRELDGLRKNVISKTEAIYSGQKAAAARFGFEPGGLQWAWRQGERTDISELEWAIVDALAMGGIGSHPGDGVGCAAQIVTAQMRRAEAAEARIAQAVADEREACAAVAEDLETVIPMWDRPGGPSGNGPARPGTPREIAAAIRSRSKETQS